MAATIKFGRRKEPRLCYSVEKGSKNTRKIRTEDVICKKYNANQSKGGPQSGPRQTVRRSRSLLATRPRQRDSSAGNADSPSHSNLESENVCLNAVRMPEAASKSGPVLKTPRRGAASTEADAHRTFGSSTSGYGSMLTVTPSDKESAVCDPNSIALRRTNDKQATSSKTVSEGRLSSPGAARFRPCVNLASSTSSDQIEDAHLTELSEKLRKIAGHVTEPMVLRWLAEAEFDVEDLRLRSRHTQASLSSLEKENLLLKKRIKLIRQCIEDERAKTNILQTGLQKKLDESRFECERLRTLRSCCQKAMTTDKATQASPVAKNVGTECDLPGVGPVLDDNTPTRDPGLAGSLQWKDFTERLSRNFNRFLFDLKEQHPNCRVQETSTALTEILDLLDVKGPVKSHTKRKSHSERLLLTQENLFQHERRYSRKEVSSGQANAKQHDVRKATDFDCASDSTLREVDSISCQSTRVAYVPDNASVTSHFTAASTVSSLQSTEDRRFQEGLAQLDARLKRLQSQFPRLPGVNLR